MTDGEYQLMIDKGCRLVKARRLQTAAWVLRVPVQCNAIATQGCGVLESFAAARVLRSMLLSMLLSLEQCRLCEECLTIVWYYHLAVAAVMNTGERLVLRISLGTGKLSCMAHYAETGQTQKVLASTSFDPLLEYSLGIAECEVGRSSIRIYSTVITPE